MKVKEAITLFRYYQQANQKKRTVESLRSLLQYFAQHYADRQLDSMKPDKLCQFLEHVTGKAAKSTQRLRYAHSNSRPQFIGHNNRCL